VAAPEYFASSELLPEPVIRTDGNAVVPDLSV